MLKLCKSLHKTIQKRKDLALLWIFLLKAKRRKRSHRALIFLELRAGLYLSMSKKTGHPSSPKCTINWKCSFLLAPRLNNSSNTTGLKSWAKFLKRNAGFYYTGSCKVTIPTEDDSSLLPGSAFCLFCFPTITREACAELHQLVLPLPSAGLHPGLMPTAATVGGWSVSGSPTAFMHISLLLSLPCITWTSHGVSKYKYTCATRVEYTVSQLLSVLLVCRHKQSSQIESISSFQK